jgi:hypothetical protein
LTNRTGRAAPCRARAERLSRSLTARSEHFRVVVLLSFTPYVSVGARVALLVRYATLLSCDYHHIRSSWYCQTIELTNCRVVPVPVPRATLASFPSHYLLARPTSALPLSLLNHASLRRIVIYTCNHLQYPRCKSIQEDQSVHPNIHICQVPILNGCPRVQDG